MKTHHLVKVAIMSVGFLSLAGCHSNPLLKVNKDNCNFVRGYLVDASNDASEKLHLNLPGLGMAEGYVQCMENKLSGQTCQKLYQLIVEDGKKTKVINNDLTGAPLFRVDQLTIDDVKDPAVYKFAFVKCPQ